MKVVVLMSLLFYLGSASEDSILSSANNFEDKLPRSPVVRTKYGQVQGRLVNLGANSNGLGPVYAFKGLPYATPPVGSNR